MATSSSDHDAVTSGASARLPSAYGLVQWIRERSRKPAVDVREDPIQAWKDAWGLGAIARWNGTSSLANPYQPRSRRADAWAAGWSWAEQQPDRRAASPVRLAHPHRRSSDGPLPLMRTARSATIGVSTLVVATWLWQIRRKRRSRAERKL
jgi:hypothetical protein